MRIVTSGLAAFVAAALVAAPVLLSASDESVPSKDRKVAPSATIEKAPFTQFATLKNVKATPMSSSELAVIKGAHVHFIEPGNGFSKFHEAGNPENQGIGVGNWYDNGSADGGLVSPSYHGLCVAGPISIPTFGGPSQCP